jgi:hypothetical protein
MSDTYEIHEKPEWRKRLEFLAGHPKCPKEFDVAIIQCLQEYDLVVAELRKVREAMREADRARSLLLK